MGGGGREKESEKEKREEQEREAREREKQGRQRGNRDSTGIIGIIGSTTAHTSLIGASTGEPTKATIRWRWFLLSRCLRTSFGKIGEVRKHMRAAEN